MPTGYTADVQEGKITEFKDFALQCARAFGACVMQMDDDPKDLPKEQDESSYYSKKISETKKEIKKFTNMTDEELVNFEKNRIEKDLKYHQDKIQEEKKEKVRYETMLEKVHAWTPPTEEHQGLKDFMIRQIKDSIKWDCEGTYHQDAIKRLEVTDISPSTIRAEKLESLEKDLAYYKKQDFEESERTQKRNQWIRDLYKSLE